MRRKLVFPPQAILKEIKLNFRSLNVYIFSIKLTNRIVKNVPAWSKQVLNSISSAVQSYATKEEDNEYDIWENCGDIDNFSRLGDSSNHAKINDRPSHNERNANGKIKLLGLVDTGR